MPKKLVTLLAVFLGLLVVSFVVMKKARATPKNANPIFNVGIERVRKIRVTGTDGPITLEQNERGWMLTAPVKDVADDESIEPIIAAFQSAVMSTVVSENPVHMEEYGVQTGQGTRIEIFLNTGDKPDIDGFIGKRGPNYTDSFFRLEGQNRVYLVGGMPTFIFPSEIDSYRLKRLLRSDPHDAVSFSFSYGTTQLHLQKSSDTWTNTDAHVAVSAEWMVQLKEKIKAISVVSYTDEPAQPVHGLDKPGLTVGISWMNEKRTLLFGKEKKSPPPGRYAQVDGRPALYVVASAPVKDLLDFLKTVPTRP
jgi:hypothetical protein